jgi:hypothetical protein
MINAFIEIIDSFIHFKLLKIIMPGKIIAKTKIYNIIELDRKIMVMMGSSPQSE